LKEENSTKLPTEKVLLVGVDITGDGDFDVSMEELEQLASACNLETVGIVTQRLSAPSGKTYVGSGKLEEIKEMAAAGEADLIVFEDTLTPAQMRNLTDALKLPIMDRTGLILDIFALRAGTAEAKLQTEVAKLKYMLPRLVGLRSHLSRQGGTGGSMSNKGAGEKKLELDRRKIEARIVECTRSLEQMEINRQTQRKQRLRIGLPVVALIGYTNAGKSTVMNRLLSLSGAETEKQVLEKDMLFATLDTAVRRIDPPDKRSFLLTDTVGFIHKLPHGLIKAFRSTLEEIRYADLLVQVVDFADENHKKYMQVTKDTLKELEIGDIPMIYVYNKCDKCLPPIWFTEEEQQIYISCTAKEGEPFGDSVPKLLAKIQEEIYKDQGTAIFFIPYAESKEVSYLREHTAVLSHSYEEAGERLLVRGTKQDFERIRKYMEPSE
jgi:GTP-binding protein HflX